MNQCDALFTLFRVDSLALEQFHDRPTASQVIPNDTTPIECMVPDDSTHTSGRADDNVQEPFYWINTI